MNRGVGPKLFGLWPIFAMLLAAAAVVGLFALMLRYDILTDYLVPSPDTVAENMVQALMAERFAGVKQSVTQDLEQQLDEQQLKQLVQSIEQAHGNLETIEGEVQQEQEDTAVVQLTPKFSDKSQPQVNLILTKENDEWKVESIDPLQALAQ